MTDAALRIVNTFPLPESALAALRAIPGVTVESVVEENVAITDLSSGDSVTDSGDAVEHVIHGFLDQFQFRKEIL